MTDNIARNTESWISKIQTKLIVTFVVVAIVPTAILLAVFATGLFPAIGVGIAISVQIIGIFVAYQMSASMIRQADTINETLAGINQGNFEARADVVTSDELGKAAVALNAMCDNTLNLIQSNDERHQIQTSIENLIAEMEEIAAGDLTIEAEVNDDITGSIALSVNYMTAQLRSIVRQVQSAAEQVTASAGSIREASTTMSQDNDTQATRISEASDQLMEMTASFQNVAAQTQDSVQVAVEARETASKGFKAVSDTVDGMQRIRAQVKATSKRIKRLGESSQEIGEIVQLISDIADRTSILALNASIQAAMAGDAGKGFAVVAEQVESLAERCTHATKQISKLINAIQSETGEAISDMEESTREVVAGSQLATQAGETLFEIDSVSNQLVELIQNISTSALQQADAATEIASNMSEISASTKDSADKSRQATQSVKQLADMAGELRDSVSQFNVSGPDEETVDSPSAAHDSADDANEQEIMEQLSDALQTLNDIDVTEAEASDEANAEPSAEMPAEQIQARRVTQTIMLDDM